MSRLPGQLALEIEVADPPAPGARQGAVWCPELDPPGYLLMPDEVHFRDDATWRLEVGEDVWVETSYESGSAVYWPNEEERAGVICGRADAAARPGWAAGWRLDLPEARAARDDLYARRYWAGRRVVTGADGWPAHDGWTRPQNPALGLVNEYVVVTRWVEALVFNGSTWWSAEGTDVAADENDGQVYGQLCGYPARPVHAVAVGSAL